MASISSRRETSGRAPRNQDEAAPTGLQALGKCRLWRCATGATVACSGLRLSGAADWPAPVSPSCRPAANGRETAGARDAPAAERPTRRSKVDTSNAAAHAFAERNLLAASLRNRASRLRRHRDRHAGRALRTRGNHAAAVAALSRLHGGGSTLPPSRFCPSRSPRCLTRTRSRPRGRSVACPLFRTRRSCTGTATDERRPTSGASSSFGCREQGSADPGRCAPRRVLSP